MSERLPTALIVKAPATATHPEEVLRTAAAQIAPLTGGALHGEVRVKHLMGILTTYDFDVFVTRKGPGYGILQVDHSLTKPYPAYVSGLGFGEVWPPPPLGPSDPTYKIAPAANTPEELVALINQVLASREARDALEFLLAQRNAGFGSNGPTTNGAMTEALQPGPPST